MGNNTLPKKTHVPAARCVKSLWPFKNQTRKISRQRVICWHGIQPLQKVRIIVNTWPIHHLIGSTLFTQASFLNSTWREISLTYRQPNKRKNDFEQRLSSLIPRLTSSARFLKCGSSNTRFKASVTCRRFSICSKNPKTDLQETLATLFMSKKMEESVVHNSTTARHHQVTHHKDGSPSTEMKR